ncbi:uncharacterized protein [Pocillopora verrucosa]|uniref:uncharacterized protein n=1 Tax=Pocillopora verrucosa TaxID=203993 RepID=UPI00334210BB
MKKKNDGKNQGELERELTFLYRNVETFMLFVGHPRSGHSLDAAILDSHPEIVISDEFNLLYKFDSFFMDPSQTNNERKLRIFYDIHTRSRRQAMFGSRSSICNSSVSYCYNIKGGWQGNWRQKSICNYCTFASRKRASRFAKTGGSAGEFQSVRNTTALDFCIDFYFTKVRTVQYLRDLSHYQILNVIRDKKTAITTGLLKNCKGLYDLRMLVRIVNIPLRLIHVIRNPFDNIATICRRELHLDPRSRQIVRNTTALDWCIDDYFT